MPRGEPHLANCGIAADSQLASWFDLQFSPRTPPSEQDPVLLSAWNYPINQTAEWPWQTTANPMNPDPTPTPPETGLDVTLSTGPNGESNQSQAWPRQADTIQLCAHIGSEY